MRLRCVIFSICFYLFKKRQLPIKGEVVFLCWQLLVKRIYYIVAEYLSYHGMFLLKVVYTNTNCVEFDELLVSLWDYYLKNYSRHSRSRQIERCESDIMEDRGERGYKYQPTAVNVDGDGYAYGSSVML